MPQYESRFVLNENGSGPFRSLSRRQSAHSASSGRSRPVSRGSSSHIVFSSAAERRPQDGDEDRISHTPMFTFVRQHINSAFLNGSPMDALLICTEARCACPEEVWCSQSSPSAPTTNRSGCLCDIEWDEEASHQLWRDFLLCSKKGKCEPSFRKRKLHITLVIYLHVFLPKAVLGLHSSTCVVPTCSCCEPTILRDCPSAHTQPVTSKHVVIVWPHLIMARTKIQSTRTWTTVTQLCRIERKLRFAHSTSRSITHVRIATQSAPRHAWTSSGVICFPVCSSPSIRQANPRIGANCWLFF
jgi:hypothetical protein